jgi:hypothetical protein
MKDLGEADVILNIKLTRNDNGIILNQSHYVEKMLSRFGFDNAKVAPTPYDVSVKLRKNHGEGLDQLRFSQIIGSLLYLAGATRPNISFAVSKLSRFTSNPRKDHWEALVSVLRYLVGTVAYALYWLSIYT